MFEIIVTHLDAPETGRDSWLLENITVIQAAFSATAKAQEARRYEVSDFESGSDEIREFVRKQKESLPTWGAKLVPPSLLENVAPIAILSDQISASESHSQLTMMQNHYQNFADTLIPQIEDRSPRDAASDPRLRPLLIEMMKDHLTGIDQQRRNIGLDFDLNPLLEELGLWEIIQPPAPCGNFGSEEEEEEEE